MEVAEGRPEFNGIYECISTNIAGSDNISVQVLLGWCCIAIIILLATLDDDFEFNLSQYYN